MSAPLPAPLSGNALVALGIILLSPPPAVPAFCGAAFVPPEPSRPVIARLPFDLTLRDYGLALDGLLEGISDLEDAGLVDVRVDFDAGRADLAIRPAAALPLEVLSEAARLAAAFRAEAARLRRARAERVA